MIVHYGGSITDIFLVALPSGRAGTQWNWKKAFSNQL